MAHFPKWFLFNESEQDRKRRHAALRNILSNSQLQRRLREEAEQLKLELKEKNK